MFGVRPMLGVPSWYTQAEQRELPPVNPPEVAETPPTSSADVKDVGAPPPADLDEKLQQMYDNLMKLVPDTRL